MTYPELVYGNTKRAVTACWKYAGLSYPAPAYDYRLFQCLVDLLTVPTGIPVTNKLPLHIPPEQMILVLVTDGRSIPYRGGDVIGTGTRNIFWNTGEGDPNVVWCSGGDRPPEELAALIAHEAVHDFQLPDGELPAHETERIGDRPNLMNQLEWMLPGAMLSPARVSRIKDANARFMRGERFGPHLLPNGTWTQGWYTKTK